MTSADDVARRYQTCVHSDACARAYRMTSPIYGAEFAVLRCRECGLYDDRHCPASWSGTMRCERAVRA